LANGSIRRDRTGRFFGLTISTDESAGSGVRVRIEGELDLATSEKLEHELEPFLAQDKARIALDLSGVSFIDSTGLRALWGVRQRAQGVGGTLVLEAPSAAVMQVLRMTKLHKVFAVTD
jgi:anti-sigma B factor antagonist